jgi:RNA polymerase-binding transcription factor DksA
MLRFDINHFECVILKRIAGMLRDVYGADEGIDPITLERRFSLQSSSAAITPIERDIEYSLAYKGDGYLVELCNALSRIKEGTYGTCLRCKNKISPEELEKSPTSRLCAGCAERLRLSK